MLARMAGLSCGKEVRNLIRLVGEWLDIEGMGPGLVRAYNKVTLNLMYDSFHRVDFSISGGGKTESVLLRRRKLLRWNQGHKFHILSGKPTPEDVERSLADEERVLLTRQASMTTMLASDDGGSQPNAYGAASALTASAKSPARPGSVPRSPHGGAGGDDPTTAARCRRCGERLPMDTDEIEDHLSRCTGPVAGALSSGPHEAVRGNGAGLLAC